MADVDAFLARELEFDLASEDEATRRAALVQLASMRKSTQLLDRFKRIATEDGSPEIRYLAKKYYNQIKAGLAGALKDQVQVAFAAGVDLVKLAAVLAGDSTELRLEALRQVIETRDRNALPTVLKAIPREQDAWVIASLVKAVGVLGDSSQIRVLQPFLRHADPRVVANAVEALELIGGELVFPILVPLLENPDHRVQGNAIKALVKFDREQALAALAKMAASDREGARDATIHCLGLLSGPEPERLLARMFAVESFPDLLKKEAQALARIGTRAILPELSRLLRAKLRERAILAKFVQKEIAGREGLSVEDLVAIEMQADRDAAAEAAAEANASAAGGGGAAGAGAGAGAAAGTAAGAAAGAIPVGMGSGAGPNAPRRATRRTTISRPIVAPPPPTAWERFRMRFAAVPAAAWAALVLGVAGVTAYVVRSSARLPDSGPAPFILETSLIIRASRAASPSDVSGKPVEFTGLVRSVAPHEGTLLVSSGNRLVHVKTAESGNAKPDLAVVKAGQTVAVTGKVSGKTKFGGVYVDRASVQVRQ
jgi:HEAT repeat protein